MKIGTTMLPSEKDYSEVKESMRTCVPWFCMEELRHVYSTIFDGDLETMKQGYKYLVIWKSRQSFMPSGVEATYGFSEVILQDGKFQDSSDELVLPQLRLMYATTIMRFLNLVLNENDGKTEKKTLFYLAEAVGIPKWIVEIRHDSAHGSILPDIEVLRSAAKFSMKWLKKRYWDEVLKTNDLMNYDGELIVSDDEDTINRVFDCWENILILKLAGLSSKKRNQPELWTKLKEIAASLKSKELRYSQDVRNIDEAVEVLREKINEMLRNKRNKFVKPIIINKMLSGESFLPSEKILALFKAKSSNPEFPEALALAWNEIMSDMWESGSIPILLVNLVRVIRDSNEVSLRQEYALLWLRQVLLSLIKVKECKIVEEAFRTRQECSENFTTNQLRFAVSSAVVAQKPELRGVFDWSNLPLPRCVLSTDLLEKCLLSPLPADIHTILPCLLELLDPPLPSHVQDSLRECVAIFGNWNKSSQKSSPDTIFTMLDVMQSDLGTNGERELKNGWKIPSESAQSKPSSIQSIWERSSDMFGWSRSALGVLPWQCDNVSEVWRNLEIKNEWKKDKSECL